MLSWLSRAEIHSARLPACLAASEKDIIRLRVGVHNNEILYSEWMKRSRELIRLNRTNWQHVDVLVWNIIVSPPTPALLLPILVSSSLGDNQEEDSN